MKRIACVAAALLLAQTGISSATMLSDYATWASLSVDAKAGVMIGIADEVMTIADDDLPLRKATGIGLFRCIQRSGIKAGSLSNTVDAWYSVDDERKKLPVTLAFFTAITHGVCKSYVDVEIKKADSSW